ncbi:MAG: S41 family peptidase [Anaerolineales bacterium]|jgi:C-terminal processing protease CtpA/Prc
MKRNLKWLGFIVVAMGTLTLACQTSLFSSPVNLIPSLTNLPSSAAQGPQPLEITGNFNYTNDIITTYYVEHEVALVDMYGFVTRNQEWEIPVDSQVLGFLQIDESAKHGTYRLELPERPLGTLVNVSHGASQGQGVQVWAATYWPNITGGPYSEGDDVSRGWPNYLASVITDPQNHDEVTGGKLVVWSPDNGEYFPTGFGPDEKLFTKDDPVGPIPAGYSIVDLSQNPFKVSQEAKPDLTLYEPPDVAIKDFSRLSYTEAFRQTVDFARTEYAFNGIPGKQLDWDALYNQIEPLVAAAERTHDPKQFALAMKQFTLAFHDGHTSLAGSLADQIDQESTASGYGFAIRELDSGQVIVVYLTSGGPADQAGIQVGAQVLQFDGKPIGEAIGQVQALDGPFSTSYGLRYQQARYLLRASPGTSAQVEFANPGIGPQTVTLRAVQETDSFDATQIDWNYQPGPMPETYTIYSTGAGSPDIGYVRINTNNDDLSLLYRLFTHALQTFADNQVSNVVIDLRVNSGGSPLGLAGYLSNQNITEGQLEYYSAKTGKFEAEEPPNIIYPDQTQFRFQHLAVLVDQFCYSACELEAYGFSQIPGVQIVGQYPTAGTEAEVARGQVNLPEGISLQIPTGRFVNLDGSLFLEGRGVMPTVKVPVDANTVQSDQDVVLQAAVNALLSR